MSGFDWIKCKNPESPAVKREAEEDWGKRVTGTGILEDRAREGKTFRL